MSDLETRELRYFLAVADEQNFGRAAARLGIAQPPLSRAIRQLESRLGVQLFVRDRRGTQLTSAGGVLVREAKKVLEALSVAQLRTERAGRPDGAVVLATKAGASHDLLQRLLDAAAVDSSCPDICLRLCEVGEQAQLLRNGIADLAIMHRPVDDMSGLDAWDLHSEEQVVIMPRSHPLAGSENVLLHELERTPGPPLARWPRIDGSYPDGPGPQVRTQSQIAQLVALGEALLVIPRSSRAWQWPEHVAVPVRDAAQITTTLAWRTGEQSPQISALVSIAAGLDLTESLG